MFRDLYGDAMLMPTWMGSNMADGNQQKHLLPSFATNAWIYSSRNSETLKEYFLQYMNCLDSKIPWNKLFS